MKSGFLFVSAMIVLACGTMAAQIKGDALGMHNLSPGSGSPIVTTGQLGCVFCHSPHSGVAASTPLWNQTLSKAAYTPYTSSTYHEVGNSQPLIGSSTSLCLSCHDGTVAVGQSVVSGKVPMVGSMYPNDIFGTQLTGSHPVSLVLPLKDSPYLVSSLIAQGITADPLQKIKLQKGNVECNSCHDPHSQNIDRISPNFLVRDSSNGQMCLACHDPNRVMTNQVNPIAGWTGSAHATATNQPTAQANVGNYGSVAQNACISCHMPHNAAVGTIRLLRAAIPAAPTLDPATQNCITCHGGGSNLSPLALNISAEFAKTGHPYPAGSNTHDAAESAVLNNNRHATCADCHNPHSAKPVSGFATPPTIRVSQTGVIGVSASDGMTIVNPAVNQAENCLRCHGTSSGKQTLAAFGYLPIWAVSGGDPLNVIPQLSMNASSSHPVTHDRRSSLAQPSLRVNMINFDGSSQGRIMGTRILCTDCHNSDDNREFGGSGPNGPHGSKWTHILERRYEFSQVSAGALPGTTITNLFPNPDMSVNGPYGLCAKCHDMENILLNASFNKHASHVNAGISCSTCHTAHGMPATSASISGERMVNFDVNVVGQNGSLPISFNRASNTCTLTCHLYTHNADGTVTH